MTEQDFKDICTAVGPSVRYRFTQDFDSPKGLLFSFDSTLTGSTLCMWQRDLESARDRVAEMIIDHVSASDALHQLESFETFCERLKKECAA